MFLPAMASGFLIYRLRELYKHIYSGAFGTVFVSDFFKKNAIFLIYLFPACQSNIIGIIGLCFSWIQQEVEKRYIMRFCGLKYPYLVG